MNTKEEFKISININLISNHELDFTYNLKHQLKHKLKLALKIVGLIFVTELIVAVAAFFLVFYGPLVNIKTTWVTTAMTTGTHHWLATLFVPQTVIDEIMANNTVELPTENTDTAPVLEFIASEPPKEDKVVISDVSTTKFRGYLLTITNPKRVSLVATPKLGRYGAKVEDLVKENNAYAGVNAGGFLDLEGKGTGGVPEGILISNYEILYQENRPSFSIIGFDKDDVLVLGHYNLEQIKTMGIRDAVCFGPYLVQNGQPLIINGDGGWGWGPRTAIGQTKDGTVLLLAIDGRQISSVGASMKEIQDIMIAHGAYTASNLDGGASTTLVYEGKVINSPCSEYGARYVPSAFIVRYGS